MSNLKKMRQEQVELLISSLGKFGFGNVTIHDNVSYGDIDGEIENYVGAFEFASKIFGIPEEDMGFHGDLKLKFERNIASEEDLDGPFSGVFKEGLLAIYDPKGNSLIHEWAHAWDVHTYNKKHDYPATKFHYEDNLKNGKQIGSESLTFRFPKEYLKNCRQADRLTKSVRTNHGNYYSAPAEMFARAVEVYIANKAKELGIENSAMCSSVINYETPSTVKVSFGRTKELLIYPTYEEAEMIIKQMGDRYRELQEKASSIPHQEQQKADQNILVNETKNISSFEERFGSKMLDDEVKACETLANEHNSTLSHILKDAPTKDDPIY